MGSKNPFRRRGRHPEPGRSERGYRVAGFILASALLLTILVTALLLVFTRSSGERLAAAIAGLALGCVLLAGGILYVFFNLQRTLNSMRASLMEEARLQSISNLPARTAEAAPAAKLEYGRESRHVEVLEGIGSVFSMRLARQGIATLDDLRAATERQVADAAQVTPPVARRWKLMADLLLVRALDAQAAELLVACGIESVAQLAAESPTTLLRKASNANASTKARIYPKPLDLPLTESWIQAAQRANEALPGTATARRGGPTSTRTFG